MRGAPTPSRCEEPAFGAWAACNCFPESCPAPSEGQKAAAFSSSLPGTLFTALAHDLRSSQHMLCGALSCYVSLFLPLPCLCRCKQSFRRPSSWRTATLCRASRPTKACRTCTRLVFVLSMSLLAVSGIWLQVVVRLGLGLQ